MNSDKESSASVYLPLKKKHRINTDELPERTQLFDPSQP